MCAILYIVCENRIYNIYEIWIMVIYGYFYMCNWMCIALSRISFIIKWVMTISFFFLLSSRKPNNNNNVDTIHSSTRISKWQFNDNGLLESNDNFEFVKKISEWRPTYLMCTLIAIHNLMEIQRNANYFKGVLSIYSVMFLCVLVFFFSLFGRVLMDNAFAIAIAHTVRRFQIYAYMLYLYNCDYICGRRHLYTYILRMNKVTPILRYCIFHSHNIVDTNTWNK